MPDDRGPGLRRQRGEVLARRDLTGRALCVELAAVTDRWLEGIFTTAVGTTVHDVALLAVGGYGRGELAPGSDLDLLLVHRNRRDIGRVAEAVWYPIWDGGVRLDHSVRTARELGSAMDDDLRVALGLLDARTVAGSTALGAETCAGALGKWQARAGRWLPEVDRIVRARHRDNGDLAFLLEPDLKEARGGLRDLHLLVGLARVVPVLEDLVAEGRLVGPWEVLTAARAELQRDQTGERNRLNLQDQDRVAAALGGDADRLMADVADASRAVAWASDDAWRRIERMLGGRSRGRRRQWTPEPLEPGITLRGGEITLAYGADPARDPTLALRLAAVSAELDVPMARDTIDSLTRAAAAPEPWPDPLHQSLLRLLGAGRPAIPAWETLDQQGVIVRLLPEWACVRNRPQRNAYHRFTVDRHLLETAANASALARRVARPDLLLLGALLHDIGKGLPGDHTDAGIEVLATLGPRLGLPAADVAVLQALIRLHLLLPEVATRRDLDDPGTIDAVAAAVGDRDTLDLLAVLTEADSLATGPAAWGSWKAGLVAALVERVGLVLDGHPPPSPPPVTSAQQELLALGRLRVVAHGSEVTVVAPDRAGLLATVAGVLAADGAAVRAATARSATETGASAAEATALLVLQVVPTRDVLPEASRLERDLAAALAGEISLEARLAEREAQLPRRRPTAAGELTAGVEVRIDHAASARAALIEVRAPDRVGTLWRMARALEATGLVITSAVVATLGAEVVDAFYVTTAGGDKPAAGDDRLEAIPDAVRAALVASPAER